MVVLNMAKRPQAQVEMAVVDMVDGVLHLHQQLVIQLIPLLDQQDKFLVLIQI